MKTVILLVVTLGFSTGWQTYTENNEASYKAYLERDPKAAKDQWIKIVSDRQKKLQQNTTDQNLLYEVTLAQFGLLSSTMRDKDEDLFEKHVDEAEKNLETLITKNKDWGEPRALLSAVYGLKMGYSPMKGMFLGSKSSDLMEQARKKSPGSPLVWKLYGNSKYHTPEAFGGDLKEAIRAYEKAIQLYEAKTENLSHNWLYIDTFAFLGQAYAKDNRSESAISIYEKVLKIEPAYTWVSYALLPKVKGNSVH
jgi:tetratricopeptide (TPR) repeat protein